ncbi:FIG023103: Predicted transmembrane protein [hydrothermal vent metagenome]|uniref:FIG023103: Predicted transmembrane protein n=1 Tax=hydrothermal vent metagenome TaxID=652676 RepID=A0A3B0ZJ45_9ZZZZ
MQPTQCKMKTFDSSATKYHDRQMNPESSPTTTKQPDKIILAGPRRQLLALFYDVWLLAAVFMVASALTLPMTQGEPVKPGNPFMTTYIFFVWYGFYAWFWTHGGQTLGMRSWKIKLISQSGETVGLWHALLRFISGIPAWLFITTGSYFSLAEQAHMKHPLLDALSKLPASVVLGVGVLLLISGHMKNSWRNQFSSTQVVLTDDANKKKSEKKNS